jgi:hypothetical protein
MTEQVSAPVVVQVFEPGEEVTVYPPMAAPPLDVGADQVIIEVVFWFDVASTLVGAPGTVEGIATAEAEDSVRVPLAFVAATVKV